MGGSPAQPTTVGPGKRSQNVSAGPADRIANWIPRIAASVRPHEPGPPPPFISHRAAGAATGDHFGFDAQVIGSFVNGKTKLNLHPDPSNDLIELSPSTGDVKIREVASS